MNRLLLALLALGLGNASSAAELERILSREHPTFQPALARLTVGRDGLVYLCSGGDNSCVLRLERDGRSKTSAPVVYMALNASANAQGIVATANGHFGHKLTFYERTFVPRGSRDDFLVNDQVGWDAPAHVEAGASGDFYGLDQHRDRILRISPTGKLVQIYSLPRMPAGPEGTPQDFRVSEKQQAFYVLPRTGPLLCVGFDGKLRWRFDGGVQWDEPCNHGGFDVDDDGILYVVEPHGERVRRVSPQGKELGFVTPRLEKRKPGANEQGWSDLRVWGTDLLLRRQHPTELFQCYDLRTDLLRHVAEIEHERLTASWRLDTWTAGWRIPVQIELRSGQRKPTPRWRVWARSVGATDYREFPLSGGAIEVPADCAGLYQVTITPDVLPAHRGTPPEYRLSSIVEICQPKRKGTASIWTPNNRVFFGRGEVIPFSAMVRGVERSTALTIRLTDGERILAEQRATSPRGGEPLTFLVPAALTSALRPGPYRLVVTGPDLTEGSQVLQVGLGLRRQPFHVIQYGDYGPIYPQAGVWDAPDKVAAHVYRTAKLGIGLVVDRIGDVNQQPHLSLTEQEKQEIALAAKQAVFDPRSAARQKLLSAPAFEQTLSGYGAHGIEQMAILMMNDASLPLADPNFDPRKPDELTKTLTDITQALRPYPAFRGWSWAANWWVYQERGTVATGTPEEKAAYKAALQRARDTGTWSPLLERTGQHRLGHAVAAQELFNQALRMVGPRYVTAAPGPYRNVDAYPPLTFRNVDEVDLQAQWEQIALPYHAAHAIDYYKRPGKRAWVHPEVWNDAGTGEQIVPTLFQAVMRGADGVGFSGSVPQWEAQPDDPRSAYQGTASVYRALNPTLKEYGPWLTSLENADRVAILVSARMLMIEPWENVMGPYYARLFEAYASCLHAHVPATFLFVEDLTPETWRRFQAILVVGQTVELEPAWQEALRKARSAGVTVFHDGTCRAGLVKEFTPLGIAFDQIVQDRAPAGDDVAYRRFAHYCRRNVPVLRKVLGKIAPPAAQLERDEMFLTERKAEDGRYLFVLNDTLVPLEPGHLWRVTLGCASRLPVQVPVRLSGEPPAVYDVFAGKEVRPNNGVIVADCRSLPGRIFAMLPARIAQVELRCPDSIKAGESFPWSLTVQDARGQPIRATVPVRLRLLDSKGHVLDEAFTSAGSKGASGTFVVPINASGAEHSVEAVELFSGLAVRRTLQVTALKLPVALPTSEPPKPASVGLPATTVKGQVKSDTFTAAEGRFGPHIRDMVLTENGALAVLNAMNWDENLYAVDTATGAVRWRQRVGHWFAFAPQPLERGVAIQGFDFTTPEGYHLWRVSGDGKPERRFALYGLPGRLPQRFVPARLRDRTNHFATAADARWTASAGGLGLAVWDRDGKLLWSQDWWKTHRQPATLAALGPDTLLAAAGMKLTAYQALSGKPLWQVELAAQGEVRVIRSSHDRRTVALLASSDGGRVFVLRDGKHTATLPFGGNDVALAPDGSRLAVVQANRLLLHSANGDLLWTLPGDDVLRLPRFSPDGKRLVVASDLGSVYVLDLEGKLLWQNDLGAVAVPAWLPDGDLLLATWMGTVLRLDGQFRERWRTRLQPAALDIQPHFLTRDATPTARIADWGNAEKVPAPLQPNLLTAVKATITIQTAMPHIELAHDAARLTDGKPDPPSTPWLDWHDLSWFAETSPHNALVIDTGGVALRLTSITFVEDRNHPESWLRDAILEYWNAELNQWVAVQPLLSNSAVHTHRLAKPVQASRFRIVLPWGLYGNLRLGEIVFHGEVTDASPKRR